MNNNWNVNNRDRRGSSAQRRRGGRGRGGNRGSWARNDQWPRDDQWSRNDQWSGNDQWPRSDQWSRNDQWTRNDQRSTAQDRTPYRKQSHGFRGGIKNNYGDQNVNRQWPNRFNRDTPGKRLSEEDIGVTEYMSDHEGFNGIIKCRYSDFQVSEINEKGEIAKLTDMTPPEPSPEKDIEEDEDLVITKYNFEILPMETWDRINSLAVNPPTDEFVEINVTGMTKEERTKIHDAVKKAFGQGIVGSTVSLDDKKVVRFEKFKKGVPIDNRVKWVWPAEYVYFIVHKENCDTMDAAARLADKLKLNIKPSMIGYSGTKDRRAKTSQWFSLRKVDPRKIAAAAKEIRDVHVGNFSFNPINLKLGMLKGNRFRIALRNVTASDELISESCERLRRNGFINYYGLQRFGTRADIPTYEIGLKLLQSNFKEAINCILQDHDPSRGPFSRSSIGETRLRRAMHKNPRDLQGALQQLPRNQRILYLHAYQSLVWNRCASRRLRMFGKQPVAGDLVPLAEVHCNNEDDDENESDDEGKPDKTTVQSDGEGNADKATEINEEDADGEEVSEKEDKTEKHVQTKNIRKPPLPVKVLTEEDVASGRYSILDVVMPVPGHNVDYPPNMLEYYKELVEKDNLKLDMTHKIKSYSLCGAYRHLVVRPGEMEWRTVRYDEPFSDLLLSDLQELKQMNNTGIVEDGKFKALLLTMSLPASAYATMALRELLKVDTSNDNQALQNNYYRSANADNEEDCEAEADKTDGENLNKGLKRSIENEEEGDAKKKRKDAEESIDDEEVEDVEKEIEENADNEMENEKLEESVENDTKKINEDT